MIREDTQNQTVPKSCFNPGDQEERSEIGCLDALSDLFKVHMVPVVLTCVGVFVIQVFNKETKHFCWFTV